MSGLAVSWRIVRHGRRARRTFGDPAAALQFVADLLADGVRWIIVEPAHPEAAAVPGQLGLSIEA